MITHNTSSIINTSTNSSTNTTRKTSPFLLITRINSENPEPKNGNLRIDTSSSESSENSSWNTKMDKMSFNNFNGGKNSTKNGKYDQY